MPSKPTEEAVLQLSPQLFTKGSLSSRLVNMSVPFGTFLSSSHSSACALGRVGRSSTPRPVSSSALAASTFGWTRTQGLSLLVTLVSNLPCISNYLLRESAITGERALISWPAPSRRSVCRVTNPEAGESYFTRNRLLATLRYTPTPCSMRFNAQFNATRSAFPKSVEQAGYIESAYAREKGRPDQKTHW